MANVILIEGPVGAGKSTFSKDLSQQLNVPHLNLDSWMVRLFRPDRPASGLMTWYVERKKRCTEQIWDVALSVLNTQSDVILEIGLLQFESRQAMYDRIRGAGHDVVVYVLDFPKDVRRQRVQYRNLIRGATFSMEVSDEIFELASAAWEAPDYVECENQKIIFVSPTESDAAFERVNP